MGFYISCLEKKLYKYMIHNKKLIYKYPASESKYINLQFKFKIISSYTKSP